MIPLTLVTGFLGSGKTTFLQQVIDRDRDRRLVLIVNEFGEIDIDGQRLDATGERLVPIPGGSIFCQCLVGEFIRTLEAIPSQFSENQPPEGVLIEASGVADPRVVRQMLSDTRMDRIYDLRQVICLIDPGSFEKLMHTLPNVSAQVEGCNVAIVNKTDLHSPATIERIETKLRTLNPGVLVIRATHGQTDLDIFDERPHRSLRGQYATCKDPNYLTQVCPLPGEVDLPALLAALDTLRAELYRVKGFVRTADGPVNVDLSASGLTTRSAPEREGPGQLVFIARPQAQRDLAQLIRQLNPLAVMTPSEPI